MTPRSICLKAAKVLSHKKLARQTYGSTNKKGAVSLCMLGAINYVSGGQTYPIGGSRVENYISDIHQYAYGERPARFNDYGAVSRKDVIKRLRELARLV